MKTELRLFTGYNDLLIIAQLYGANKRQALYMAGTASKEEIDDSVNFQILYMDGTPIAALDAHVVIGNPKLAYIKSLVVHPALRHKGIGTDLVNHLKKVYKKSGCTRIELESTPYAITFWIKMGFKPINIKAIGKCRMGYDIKTST